MSKYVYDITGNYKDWLEMKTGDTILHKGSLIGFISYSNNRLELNLNYGKDTCHRCELKKKWNVIITVPIEEHLLETEYIYIPLVFNKEEYEEFIEISYIDRDLLNNVRQLNKQDVYNMLSMDFRLQLSISGPIEFKDIIENTIAFSEEDDRIAKCINIGLSNESLKIHRLDKNSLKHITLFVNLSGKLYEWGSIIKAEDKFYFKLMDDYVWDIN